MIKVLWFSNTPALGAEFIDNNSKIKGTGGWMYTLNKLLQDQVRLSVAFHHPYKLANFKYENTNFFPIYTGNIVIENLKSRFFNRIYDDDFLESYLRIIDEVKPDIIHIHGTENSFLCILDKTEIPIVISIQGNLTVYYHKYFSSFYGKYLNDKEVDFTLKSFIFGRNNFNRGYKKMKLMKKVEQKYLTFSKYIIGRTNWDKRISRVLAPRSKYFIGNEILRDGFYVNRWYNPYECGKLILFSTNGNNYYKGFETICYTLTLLNRLGMKVEWRVAGVSNRSLIHKITKKHLKNNYPDVGLKLLGSLTEDELIKNLNESNIYVMPSHIENSPNNLCEAMIIGVPCVATYAGGTPSILENNIEGFLVQDGDPWAMAGAILELAESPDIAVQFGNKAREKALKRHDRERVINDLINVYNNIINENSNNNRK